MNRHRLRAAVVTLSTAIAVIFGGSFAVAAWTSTGSGTATGKAGSALNPTTTVVAGSAITSGLLYPGLSGDVKITVNNPNPYPVRVTNINGTGAVTASGGTGTCTTTGVTFTNTTLSSGNAIAANASATFTLTDAANMSTSSQDGCQNAVFTIPVLVTVASG